MGNIPEVFAKWEIKSFDTQMLEGMHILHNLDANFERRPCSQLSSISRQIFFWLKVDMTLPYIASRSALYLYVGMYTNYMIISNQSFFDLPILQYISDTIWKMKII